MKIGIAGYGFVGQAHESIFKQSHTVIISDPVKEHYGDLRHADMIIVCVSTPEADNGSCDMSNVLDVLRNAPDVPILIKSTISLEGWNTIQELYPDREICFSPEFLRAASALQDFKNCNTILIGGNGYHHWQSLFLELLGCIDIRVHDVEQLILIKYFRNSFLATKVAFFNQIFDLCEEFGIDYEPVRKEIAQDERITESHTQVTEERGFGGHCFPKDTSAIIKTAKSAGIDLSILQEAINYNLKIRS